MNEMLQKYARCYLKNNLIKLSQGNRDLFKRMYGKGKMDLSIEDVVDKMPADKLDWAMCQVKNTLKKNNIIDVFS